MAVHVVLHETGLPFTLERVDLRTGKTVGGVSLRTLTAKGYVPVLALPGDEVLTEVSAILLYLAERVPDRALAGTADGLARIRTVEWLNFIASELHKPFSPLYHPAEAVQRDASRQVLRGWLDWLDGELEHRRYLLGDAFTVADAYLFTMLVWAQRQQLMHAGASNLARYHLGLTERPAVAAVLRDEGLAG